MNDKLKPTDYVTQNEFHRFIRVQRGGICNMVSPDVQTLALIDKQTHMCILNNYKELEEEYGQPE